MLPRHKYVPLFTSIYQSKQLNFSTKGYSKNKAENLFGAAGVLFHPFQEFSKPESHCPQGSRKRMLTHGGMSLHLRETDPLIF